MRKLLEVMDVIIALMMVMVSWVYVYVQTHQIMCIKHVLHFCILIQLQWSCQKKKKNFLWKEGKK